MNTIKMYLAESGRIADLRKDFPLYQGQYQNKLLNVFVPTSILAPNFSVQQAGQTIDDYVSSTAVKIGMKSIERNGKIRTSKTYYMRYLKTLTYQNVEYALYERKLPREFTFYAGQGENAPVLVANVVNVNNETDPATIIEITPSQTCSLDVMPSGYLDTDEPVEATALEEINGRLNAIDENLALKQNIQDDTLETTAKTIVGAINENKGRIDTNTQNIATNRQDIATNRNDIDRIIATSSMGEEYIGQLRGPALPTEQQLTTFVSDTVDRQPKNGDTIIFIYEITGETDKNYKYIYSADGWKGYEIPPIENASNGSLGLIEGTYTIENYDMLVDISGGQIRNIYIKDSSATYRNLVEYLNTTTQDIADIIDGTSVVGEAMKALEDGLGNNIVNTYLTKNLGATKQYVRDYAMPREFNDTYFIATAGYLEQVPTAPESGVQFTATTNNVGDFQLFQISRENKADFELSAKNGYSNNIYVSASADCVVAFRLTTQYKKLGQDWADLNVELTSPITLTAGEIQKLMFGNPFTYLGEDVITLTDGDMFRQTLEVVTQTSSAIEFSVYSNEIYPSTFNLTVQSYVLSGVEQSESKIIMLGLDGVIESNNVVFKVQNAESYLEFRTNQREFLVTAYLPVVGVLDQSLPIRIEFGDKVYNVYTFMKGSATPITVGDFWSVGTYSAEIGYAFVSKMIFLETSDYVGFAISPATITANQLSNIIDDTDTIIHSLDASGTKIQLNLSPSQVNKLMRALITPNVAPSGIELVAINTNNSQIMLTLGEGLYVADGQLKVTGTGEQGGTTNFNDLDNKPTLDTTNTNSLEPNSNETIQGKINLHKVSKTGAYADLVGVPNDVSITETKTQFAKGYSENQISNVTEWNKASVSNLTQRQRACAYGNGYYVIAGSAGEMVYSLDGTTWTPITPFTSDVITGLAYGNGRFLAVDSAGNIFKANNPNDTWENIYNAGSIILEGIRFINSSFVVVGDGGYIALSKDGLVWETKPSGTELNLIDIAYGDGKYIAVGYSGIVLYSINGDDWFNVSDSQFTTNYRHIVYGNGLFVAGGQGGAIRYSNDGITWITATTNSQTTIGWIRGFAYAENRYYAVMYTSGGSGEIWESKNGSTWSLVKTTTERLWCVAVGEDIFFASGDNGAIYTLDLDITWLNDRPTLTPSEFLWSRNVAIKNDGETLYGNSFFFGKETSNATNSQAGIIKIATDQEAENGTSETTAVNPKQLQTAIQGLGTVFDFKGSKPTPQDLPQTGNEIGDVWYVVSEQVGYIWLNDGSTDKWEQFGSPIDLSGYVQYSDIINSLTSTATNKPLSAAQGKALNDQLNSLSASVGTNQQSITGLGNRVSTLENDNLTNKANITALQNSMATVQVYNSVAEALAASQADPNKICLY